RAGRPHRRRTATDSSSWRFQPPTCLPCRSAIVDRHQSESIRRASSDLAFALAPKLAVVAVCAVRCLVTLVGCCVVRALVLRVQTMSDDDRSYDRRAADQQRFIMLLLVDFLVCFPAFGERRIVG